ncbi:hypothetical protein WJT86_00930 [Microvirga sp. W0021]|uniref:RDD family protein n=1 Tax=Hohaiivirga grylli TaxID=3133970 RepID=A0ABV0BG03_9HYPH
MAEQPSERKVSNIRIICTAFLDFLTAFAVMGYLIGLISGQTTENGFSLSGGPALILFILIIAYFVIGNRTGGTIWKRILKVPAR